jgi:diguanylate cyclase (GGDEF)-like protein
VAAPCRKPAELAEQSPQLVAQLARHLELDPLLTHFSRLAGEYVPHDSLSFRHEFAGSEQAVVVGATARNACSYQLTVEDTRLGTLSLSRRRRFDESELHTVEQLLGVVVYPLRNALLYYRALRDAATDRLTGLANRGVFHDSLAREVSRAQRYGSSVALLMADLDNLKPINDRHGHSAGDRALQQVAEVLRGGLRDSDQVFRYAGDEFALLLVGSAADSAREVADRLRVRVGEVSDLAIQPTISVGLACLREDDSAQALFERADAALYAAKRSGRNCVCSAD